MARRKSRRGRGAHRAWRGVCCAGVRDFASVGKVAAVDSKIADAALSRLEVDALGLDAMDRRYLSCIAENYGGGPVGVETLAPRSRKSAMRSKK